MAAVLTTTTIDTIGENVVVMKRRTPAGDGSARLRSAEALEIARTRTEAEGRWLAAAQHGGVVRLRRVSSTDGALTTYFAAMLTLRTARLPPRQTAATLARVAETLGDLHRRGVVHGNLMLDHIVVAGHRLERPLLCSPSPEPCDDPAIDVMALASLVEQVGHHERTNGPFRRSNERRRWQRAIDELRNDSGRLGASGAAQILAKLSA